jgi:hypothetical protein
MANKTKDFDSLFEGMDLNPEFAQKLKEVFESAVEQKIQEREAVSDMQQMAAGAALAAKRGVIPASALKGASVDMYKSMTEKQLSDMAGAKRSDLPMKAEETEDDEEMMDVELELSEAEVDPKELAMDQDMRKILSALKVNPSMFARSLKSAMDDIEGNIVADDAFGYVVTILKAVADNPTIATRLANYLRDMESQPEPTEEPAMEEAMDKEDDIVNEVEDEDEDEIEVYEAVVESVDKYLTYVAESWVEDNKLAIEEGLRTEIAESFISGLKNLFSEHNITVPEEKNIVEDLNTKIVELENKINEQKEKYDNQLNEEITRAANYRLMLDEQVRYSIIDTVSKDLSLTQKEKFKTLAEEIQFDNKASYEEKLKVLVKTAFESKSTKKKLTEDSLKVDENTEIISDNPVMNIYANAISKNLKF